MVMDARKFILLIIFVVLLGTSREILAQKISIHMNNATLEEVLKKIKKKTKYDMMYQMKDVKEIDNRQSVHFERSYRKSWPSAYKDFPWISTSIIKPSLSRKRTRSQSPRCAR